MDSVEQTALRVQTEKRRHAPETQRLVRCPFGRGVRFEAFGAQGPFELGLETTDGTGTIAVWLNDAWWTEILQRWAEDAVTVTLDPTRDALLHPVILHQLEMVRRVAPAWRIVGVAYRNDLTDPAAIPTLVLSPYHEVRFLDADRPTRSGDVNPPQTTTLAELLARIRGELEHCGRTTPALVRIPAPDLDR